MKCFSRAVYQAAILFAFAAPLLQVARAQDVFPAAFQTLDQILKQGRELERQDRWTDALHWYQDHKRQHLGDGNFMRRMDVARAHVDAARRYSDESFRNSTKSLSFADAMGLYDEVLSKIDSHYVESPQWMGLCDRGALSLQVAIKNPEFKQLFGEVDRELLKSYLEQLRQRRPEVVSRQKVEEFVSSAAKLGEKQLGIPSTVVVLEYVAGAVGALDDYSAFLTPGQLDEVYSQIEGNFVGLGVELKPKPDALQIVKVLPGSPAQRAGIVEGDLITQVDGKSTREEDPEVVADLLQGEEGSVVEVVVERSPRAPQLMRIRREHVEIPSVEQVRIVDAGAGIGYLKLNCFQKTTSSDVNAALWQLHQQGMQSLVMDLRGNPGGLLTAAVELADKFVEKGVIVSTRGRNPGEDFSYSAQLGGTWRIPLVVMIDHDSASASEIFAGAIRDHKRGVLVGDRSYGKGSVQGIFPLNHGGAGLRLTTARFFSPSGQRISDLGVEPHVKVSSSSSKTLSSSLMTSQPLDNCLQAAVNAAKASERR